MPVCLFSQKLNCLETKWLRRDNEKNQKSFLVDGFLTTCLIGRDFPRKKRNEIEKLYIEWEKKCTLATYFNDKICLKVTLEFKLKLIFRETEIKKAFNSGT